MTTFKDLNVGDTFDWIDDNQPQFNSFYERCEKITYNTYRSLITGECMQVGTVNALIYHVEKD